VKKVCIEGAGYSFNGPQWKKETIKTRRDGRHDPYELPITEGWGKGGGARGKPRKETGKSKR